ncbi:MAG: DUF742 domain-containing protein [Haloechinothrix sp.]
MSERVRNEPGVFPAPGPPAQRTRSLVRPYARTGGRTRPDHNLALEAMVSTSQQGRTYDGVRTEEHRIICGFCVRARTIADIVSELGLPLGVVKVIVADMAHAGLVHVQQPGLTIGDRSSKEFMARLLEGLHNL